MDKKKHSAHAGDAEHTRQEAVEAFAFEGAGAEPQAVDDRVKQLEEALAAKEAEARANWDKFVRERADLENFRKRTQKEKEELVKYGNESLVQEILPVLDNMERALNHASAETQAAVIEGVKLTHGMLQAALKKFGVVPIEVAKGAAFDPALHHAMQQVESEELAPNTIAEVYQQGYLLNDRLLRAALVSVAIAPKKG
ncbi:MAG TPA: nucleotide exchange factor GrpE [Geobacteraceae bacterium]